MADAQRNLFAAIKNNDHDLVRQLAAGNPGILQTTSKQGTIKAVGYAVQTIVFQSGATSAPPRPAPSPPSAPPVANAVLRNETAIAMISTLCDLGADPNDRGNDTTDTALHTAIMPGPLMEQLVRLLLEKGADPRLENLDGQTPEQECTNVRATRKAFLFVHKG